VHEEEKIPPFPILQEDLILEKLSASPGQERELTRVATARLEEEEERYCLASPELH
jgi:hypothetical protein